MEDRKKEHGILGTLFRMLLILILGALLLAAGFLAAWGATARPALYLYTEELTVEAGEDLDLSSVRYKTEHALHLELRADTTTVNTAVPGDYEVLFTLEQPEIDRLIDVVVRNEHLQAVLPVHVRDTVPPVLTVIADDYLIGEGDTVHVEDLVTQASDLSEVTISFDDGTTEKTFDKAGSYQLRILAEDESGNAVSADASVIVKAADNTPPEISGADDVVIQTGTAFDLMSGVTVTDNSDEQPSVTVDTENIDTSAPAVYNITYTASDELGNTTAVQRKVRVADTVGNYNGRTFAITWDHTGVPNQPYLVAVNRIHNVVTVYQQDETGFYTVPVYAFLCSTGEQTPTGRYTTLERYRWQYLFEDSWGQYATRITGHILFHSVPYYSQNPADLEYEEFNKLGTAASLGCVRLSVEDVKWIYDNCPTGFPCVIYDDEESAGPLGTPAAKKTDVEDTAKRGWDPTDPDPANPWLLPETVSAEASAADTAAAESSPAETEHTRMLEED
ncbi:MAG: DUF5011 domain-containing protein [Lachnospiraceae bacterium]|nr:DUF5011 domain-containing protein [Lachnospiraceae bacterium]